MDGLEPRVAPVTGLAEFLHGRPRALRVGEVAALLGVSERFVYKLASERRIPAFAGSYARCVSIRRRLRTGSATGRISGG